MREEGRRVSRNAIKKGRESAQFSSGECAVQQWRMRSSAVENAQFSSGTIRGKGIRERIAGK